MDMAMCLYLQVWRSVMLLAHLILSHYLSSLKHRNENAVIHRRQ